MPSETVKHGVGLNHLPSGRFAANAAWLAVQVHGPQYLARGTAASVCPEQEVTTIDPQTTGLCLGRTDHPLGTPIDPAPSPALALGGAVQPRPGPTASHSTPSLTAPVPPLTRLPTQRPCKVAPAQSLRAPTCRVLSRHLALHSHCRPPSVPPKAPADRPPTSRLPKFEPGSSRL